MAPPNIVEMKYEVSIDDLIRGFKALKIEYGDVIFVHSSLSSLGYVVNGVNTVINALLEVVGDEGTIIMPTFTGSIKDCLENPPFFKYDEPCWTGVIPENFRRRGDSIRSLHPTHSVASIGSKAYTIVKGHEDSLSPCGDGTPYIQLYRLNGKIMFLGVDLACNTFFHTVEELADVPYHLQPEPVKVKIEDRNCRVLRREMYLHAYGTPRRFREAERFLMEEDIIRIGMIGRAEVRIIDAREMLDVTIKKLRENPLFLVDEESVALECLIQAVKMVYNREVDVIRLYYYVPYNGNIIIHDDAIKVHNVKLVPKFLYGMGSLKTFEIKLNFRLSHAILDGGCLHWIRISRSDGDVVNIEVLHSRSINC